MAHDDPALIARTARVVHEGVRAYQTALGEPAAPAWDEAEEWQRTSTFDAVKFRLDNPDAPPSAQHDQWMAHKIAEGWVWGAVKDPRAKTHPLLVPYEKLGEADRRKDLLIGNIILALTGPI
jgi:hypothetical protein